MSMMSRLSHPVLALGIAATLNACSSALPETQPPNPPEAPDPYLSVYNCLDLNVQAPSSITEGKGFAANLTLTNTCNQAFGLPLSNATSIKDGEDTGVELYFQINVTELADPSGGYPLIWSSVDPNPNYVETRSVVVLNPGESLKRELSWNGQRDNGDVLTTGQYVLDAQFFYIPNVTNTPEDDEYVVSRIQPFHIVEQ